MYSWLADGQQAPWQDGPFHFGPSKAPSDHVRSGGAFSFEGGVGWPSSSLDRCWNQVGKNESEKDRTTHKQAIVESLRACGRDSEAEWVDTCGENFRVGTCLDCGARPAYPITCGHRLCPDCAAKRASILISEHEEMLKQLRYPKMLTLTFLSVKRLTREYYDWARRCFTRLRHRKVMSGCWGGIYSFETTYSKEHGWHVHIHALIGSGWIDQAELSKKWKQITGACVVDIRSVKSYEGGKWGAVQEVIKYPSKTITFCEDPNLVDEFLRATERVNLCYGFGALYRVRPKRRSDKKMRCPVCDSENIAWNGDYGFCVPWTEVEWVGNGWLWRGPPVKHGLRDIQESWVLSVYWLEMIRRFGVGMAREWAKARFVEVYPGS